MLPPPGGRATTGWSQVISWSSSNWTSVHCMLPSRLPIRVPIGAGRDVRISCEAQICGFASSRGSHARDPNFRYASVRLRSRFRVIPCYEHYSDDTATQVCFLDAVAFRDGGGNGVIAADPVGCNRRRRSPPLQQCEHARRIVPRGYHRSRGVVRSRTAVHRRRQQASRRLEDTEHALRRVSLPSAAGRCGNADSLHTRATDNRLVCRDLSLPTTDPASPTSLVSALRLGLFIRRLLPRCTRPVACRWGHSSGIP